MDEPRIGAYALERRTVRDCGQKIGIKNRAAADAPSD